MMNIETMDRKKDSPSVILSKAKESLLDSDSTNCRGARSTSDSRPVAKGAKD